jgi:MFS family permease
MTHTGKSPGTAHREGPFGTPYRAEGLWSRDFKLFLLARAAARLGDAMLPVALASGLLGHGYQAGAVGLAMGSPTLAWASLVIFAGVLADRRDTRRLMIGADLLRMGTQGLVAYFFWSGHVVLWQICLIGLVNGAASAVFQPGVAGTVRALSRDPQKANGAIKTAESVTYLTGPALAGLIVGLASAGDVFMLHSLIYAVSGTCLIAMRLPRPRTERKSTGQTTPGLGQGLQQGWQAVKMRPWLWGVLALWSLFALTARGPTGPLIATAVVQRHGVQSYGFVNSALGAGTVLGGVLAMRINPRHQLRAGAGALALFALMPAAVGAALPLPALAASAAVAGTGISFWGVMWATSLQTQVPYEVVNRVSAFDMAGSMAMLPVGQALAGPAASAFGLPNVLLVGGTATVAMSLALLAVPAVRRLSRVDAVE